MAINQKRQVPRHPAHSVASAIAAVGADGTFEGYASLFDREDMGRDVVAPGAFAECLRRRGARGVKMLFQHDANQPIGVWQTIREDARGLFVSGRLLPDVIKGREVIAMLRAGAIDGLSIGFRALGGRRDRSGLRRLTKIDLWEISVVTFPMLPDARISTVKAKPCARAAVPPTARVDPATALATRMRALALSLRA